MIKRMLKMIFCKHEWEWASSTVFSNSQGELDHEFHIIDVRCKKCGRKKSIEFTKTVDNSYPEWYNKHRLKKGE